jgi:hypothetical protein
MKVANAEVRSIDYRLNILGIRVNDQSCQLIAKTSDEWGPIGPRTDLPVDVPQNAEELKAAATDPLRLTAYQFNAENPGSDIVEVLNKSKDFATAMINALAAAAEQKL